MLSDEKYKNLIQSLYEALSSEFEDKKHSGIYSMRLPNSIQYVNEEDHQKFGHPIRWILSGYAGNHGFIIGNVFKEDEVQDDGTEQNYYPPILTQTLASLGSEYVYSQIAIVLIEEDVREETLNWLYNWSDDSRYFRKVLVRIASNDKPEIIAKRIVENILFPWDSIKVSPLLSTAIAELFDDEEEEE